MLHRLVEPKPQLPAAYLKRGFYCGRDLAFDSFLFFIAQRDAKIASIGQRHDLSLEGEFGTQLIRRWVIRLAKQTAKPCSGLIDQGKKLLGESINRCLETLRQCPHFL